MPKNQSVFAEGTTDAQQKEVMDGLRAALNGLQKAEKEWHASATTTATTDVSDYLRRERLTHTLRRKLYVLIGAAVAVFVFTMLPLPMSRVFNSWSYQGYMILSYVPVAILIWKYIGHGKLVAGLLEALLVPALTTFLMYEVKTSAAWVDGSFDARSMLAAAAYTAVSVAILYAVLHALKLDRTLAELKSLQHVE